MERLINQFPFPAQGINTDNDMEFINYHFQKYLKDKHQKMNITRSRLTMKNDNERAEEKNPHHLREIVGYGRFDHPGYIKLLNRIYGANNLLTNHFDACSRIISKTRQGGKLKKKPDQSRTPCTRVMETLKPGRRKEKPAALHKGLNPLKLRDHLENALRQLFAFQARLEKQEEGLPALPYPLGSVWHCCREY